MATWICIFLGFHWGNTGPRVLPKRNQKIQYSSFKSKRIHSHLVCVSKGFVIKPNVLSPHCPCSGPSGCCWAVPDYFSSHHEARQPYWPALRSAPSASWVTIHRGTLKKQNDVREICHLLNPFRLPTSAAGESFTHGALTDTLIIQINRKKKKSTSRPDCTATGYQSSVR